MTCPSCGTEAVEFTCLGDSVRTFQCPKCRAQWTRSLTDDVEAPTAQPLDDVLLEMFGVAEKDRKTVLTDPLWPLFRQLCDRLGSIGCFNDGGDECESGPES